MDENWFLLAVSPAIGNRLPNPFTEVGVWFAQDIRVPLDFAYTKRRSKHTTTSSSRTINCLRSQNVSISRHSLNCGQFRHRVSSSDRDRSAEKSYFLPFFFSITEVDWFLKTRCPPPPSYGLSRWWWYATAAAYRSLRGWRKFRVRIFLVTTK